ncbi:IS3 family transposase [Enterococcus durans]
MESFFDLLKRAIDQYIYYYNYRRMKTKLNWQDPVQFYETTQLDD